MDAKALSTLLAKDAETVVRYLLPHGKREGKEWAVGSIHGEAGDSLKVRLEGSKAGIWADFSTSDKGDLIDLWRLTRGIPMAQALAEIRDHLGVRAQSFEPLPARSFQRPVRPRCQKPKGEAFHYLIQTRGLTPATIEAFQLGEAGEKIIFPSLRDGELILWKSLSIKRSPTGKKVITTSPEAEPCLFGWQALDPNAASVVITEGELDAMSLHQMGIPALSVPFGAGGGEKQRWLQYEYPHLERFREIYLCMDPDAAGQEASAEIVRRLGAHRCRIVSMAPHKDPNAALVAGEPVGFFEKALETAQSLDPIELKRAASYVVETMEEFYPSADEPLGLRLPWTDEFRLRPSELTVWTGINGHGKSQLLGQVVLEALSAGESVCIASMEITPRRLLYRLTRQATTLREPSYGYIEAVHTWFGDRLWLFDVLGQTKSERILEVFAYAYKRYGVRHFVIDSLMKCGIAEDDYRGQKAFIEALADFKNQYQVHVHLVAHSRKGESESQLVGKLDVKGTGAITDLADNACTVWRNKAKEEEQRKGNPDPKKLESPDALLIIDKQRNGEWEGKIGLAFDLESFQFKRTSKTPAKRYVAYSGGAA